MELGVGAEKIVGASIAATTAAFTGLRFYPALHAPRSPERRGCRALAKAAPVAPGAADGESMRSAGTGSVLPIARPMPRRWTGAPRDA